MKKIEFIGFAGIERSGKTTIVNLLKKLLNHDLFYFTKEPRLFKSELLIQIIVPSKLNFLFFFLDRIFHKIKLIKYRNKIIISDRSIICGIAYAYAVSKFNYHFQKLYCHRKWLIPIPKLVFYIVPEFKNKNKTFNDEFITKVKKGYETCIPRIYSDLIILKIHNKKGRVNKCVKKIFNVINEIYSNIDR